VSQSMCSPTALTRPILHRTWPLRQCSGRHWSGVSRRPTSPCAALAIRGPGREVKSYTRCTRLLRAQYTTVPRVTRTCASPLGSALPLRPASLCTAVRMCEWLRHALRQGPEAQHWKARLCPDPPRLPRTSHSSVAALEVEASLLAATSYRTCEKVNGWLEAKARRI